jgi:hypothetical protein
VVVATGLISRSSQVQTTYTRSGGCIYRQLDTHTCLYDVEVPIIVSPEHGSFIAYQDCILRDMRNISLAEGDDKMDTL